MLRKRYGSVRARGEQGDAVSVAKAAPVEGEQVIAMVSVTSAADYRGEIRAGRHHLVADEGPEVGGDDEGPNPYQLVLAGLVQCTAATLRMYANRKGWALGEVKVRARILRTGDGASKVERIERTIKVDGDLSAEQKQRLAEIAERTPVTRTLRAGMDILTTVG
jgi:putative redox protein